MDSNQQTTFGAIVEKRQKSPKTAQSPALSLPDSNLSTGDIVSLGITQDTPRLPDLHLSVSDNHLYLPFSSPYDMLESPNEHSDLESGLYQHENSSFTFESQGTSHLAPSSQTASPFRSTPSPMLGEITEEEETEEDVDSISRIPTKTNSSSISHNSPSPPSKSSTPNTRAPPSNYPLEIPVYEKNLLASTVSTLPQTPRSGGVSQWPSQKDMKEKAKADKLARAKCAAFGRLSRKMQIIVSFIIALMVIGTAVGVGVGVSRAYGGSVWAGNGRTQPIGGPI